MKFKKLFINGKEMKLKELERDQLYRILKNAILVTAGKERFIVPREYVEIFMGLIFEAREKYIKNIDPKKEAEKAMKYIERKIFNGKS